MYPRLAYNILYRETTSNCELWTSDIPQALGSGMCTWESALGLEHSRQSSYQSSWNPAPSQYFYHPHLPASNMESSRRLPCRGHRMSKWQSWTFNADIPYWGIRSSCVQRADGSDTGYQPNSGYRWPLRWKFKGLSHSVWFGGSDGLEFYLHLKTTRPYPFYRTQHA